MLNHTTIFDSIAERNRGKAMNFEYETEKQRRIAQFAAELKPMHYRTVQVVNDCCFAIINERTVDDSSTSALTANTQAEKKAVVTIGDTLDDLFVDDNDSSFEMEGWDDDGWREENSDRFVQIIFLEHHFEMDLPRTTLWPNEAKTILRNRSNFFFLGSRAQTNNHSGTTRSTDIHRATIRDFNPLRKAYVHGDFHSVADDIAYIFFTLWRFPIDSTLYLTTFGGGNNWDNGKPLN